MCTVFNAGKHDLATMKKNIYEYAKKGESNDELINKLNYSGGGLIDVYTGKLSIEEIQQEVADFLKKRNLLDYESYKNFIKDKGSIKKRGYYITITLSDETVMTLRMGEDAVNFVHIHPGRHSPNTFRIRANTLKTTAYTAFLALCRDVNPFCIDLINEARHKLGLSPIGKKENPEAIYKTLARLDFSK